MNLPICLVEVHTESEVFTLSSSRTDSVAGTSPSGDLLACHTQKRLGFDAGAGTFELRLTRVVDREGRTWQDKIRPMNMVVIQMMHHAGRVAPLGAGEMHTVMIGWVDHVQDTLALNPFGVPDRHILVRGRDATRFFLDGMVTYWNFLGATLLGAQTFLDVSRFNSTPAVVAKELVTEIFARFLRGTVRFNGQDVRFWDLLMYRFESFDAEIPGGLDYRFLHGEGSFWSYFIRIASPPFHELFVDTRRVADVARQTDPIAGTQVLMSGAPSVQVGKDRSAPVVMLRPTPFPYLVPEQSIVTGEPRTEVDDEGNILVIVPEVAVNASVLPWERLARHEIGIADGLREGAVGEALSRSGAEQFNVYLPRPTYPLISERNFMLTTSPVIDARRFRTYGYRPLMPECSLLQPLQSADQADPMMAWYTTLAWKLASWNVLNDEFVSGTKTLQLSPHLHIGERLVDQSSWQVRPMEFYIESVSHQWTYGQGARTTAGLTRGLPEASYQRFESLPHLRYLSAVAPTDITDTYNELVTAQTRMP